MTIDIERLKVDESLWPESYWYAVFTKYGNHVAWTDNPEYWESQGGWMLIARPTTKQWGGPVIGQKCRVDHSRTGEYERCIVHGKSAIKDRADWFVYEVLDGEYSGAIDVEPADLFRPIKTTAERERDEVMAAATKVANEVVGHEAGLIPVTNIVEALYELGMLRKREG